MKRTLICETKKKIEKRVKILGWVNSVRDHGKVVFLDVRDRTGILQVFLKKEILKRLPQEEDVVEIEGKIQKRPLENVNPNLETGEIELFGEKLKILAKSKKLPFDLKALKLKLPKMLDWRPVCLKSEKQRAIFKVQSVIVEAFKKACQRMGFFEFQSPILVAEATEGGAEVFEVNYYGKKAFLAQSPQLYKQILVASFERVFTVCKAFRAEPSETTRHLSEFTSLDCEVGFVKKLDDLLEIVEKIFKEIFLSLKKNCKKELEIFQAKIPSFKKIPKISFFEAKEILKKRGVVSKEEFDFSPEEEKEISKFAKEKFFCDLLFLTHFPLIKRPFYTMADKKNPQLSLSFDLLFSGLEVVSGGLRIHQYRQLLKSLKERGLNPKNFKFYLKAFQYGMPPHGGFGIGLERLTKQILNLENIREATLFVRDLKRIDLRLK